MSLTEIKHRFKSLVEAESTWDRNLMASSLREAAKDAQLLFDRITALEAQLAAAERRITACLALLKAREWEFHDGVNALFCRFCGSLKINNHHKSCKLAALLQETR